MKNLFNKIKANRGDETVNYPLLIVIGILLVAVIISVIVPKVTSSIQTSGAHIQNQTACAVKGGYMDGGTCKDPKTGGTITLS